MISELLKYLTSHCGINARKHGYLRESIAIESRYRRVGRSWAPHIQKTAQAIMLASGHCQCKNTVIVLGSGSLIDIPLKYLATTFKNVYLVDIVFTLNSRLKALKYSNVTFCLSDLSGFMRDNSKAGKNSRPVLTIPDLPKTIETPDLCISANLLTQLPILPRKYLEKNGTYNEQQLNSFCLEIINNHLLLLNNLKTNICLITDSQYDIYDRDNNILASDDMLYGFSHGQAQQQWSWELAPIGEINPSYGARAQVEYHYWDSGKNS